jgi:hypothetical protein
MIRSSCPTCRLRFTRATAARLASCPFCAKPLQNEPAADVLGYRLLSIEPLLGPEPDALATLDIRPPYALPTQPRHHADA